MDGLWPPSTPSEITWTKIKFIGQGEKNFFHATNGFLLSMDLRNELYKKFLCYIVA